MSIRICSGEESLRCLGGGGWGGVDAVASPWISLCLWFELEQSILLFIRLHICVQIGIAADFPNRHATHGSTSERMGESNWRVYVDSVGAGKDTLRSYVKD